MKNYRDGDYVEVRRKSQPDRVEHVGMIATVGPDRFQVHSDTQWFAFNQVSLTRLVPEQALLAAVKAERQRCIKTMVEPLLEAARDALAQATAEWDAVGNHPASRHGKDVRYYNEIITEVERAMKEKP